MSLRIGIHGSGAVSPAGWGVAPLQAALQKNLPLPTRDLQRPGWEKPLRVRSTPVPSPRPAFVAHPRLRRTSPISQHAVAAALEALGRDAEGVRNGTIRLGILVCVMSGCVQYSRRFYDEARREPATASPLLFPETVFNAPASHLAALLGTRALNATLVGDPALFPQAVALAAAWIEEDRVDACLVVGAEEIDWLTADAFRLFARDVILGEGAGAIYLKPGATGPALAAITDAHLFTKECPRNKAAKEMQHQLAPEVSRALLVDGIQGSAVVDAAELAAWNQWRGATLSPKRILGEGLMAASAWQWVAAAQALENDPSLHAAHISTVGCNQQAVGATLINPPPNL